MKMVEIDKFCCGCTIKQGALIVGAFSVVMPIVSWIVDGITGVGIVKIFILCEGYITYSILLVVSCVLIFGVLKEIAKCLLPWLIFYMISLIYTPIYAMYESISYLIDGNFLDGFLVLISLVISMAVNSYFWVIVYTYFRDLMKSISSPAPMNQPTLVQSA